MFPNQSSECCWGYENDLQYNSSCLLYKPICDGPSESWASNRDEQMKIFFATSDFGYLRERMNELRVFCKITPKQQVKTDFVSRLECTQYLRLCRARNVFIDFENLANLREPARYREDILRYGDLGGWNCELDRKSLLNEGNHKSPLMSWFTEIANFKVLNDVRKCDIIIYKPTYIIKLDATVNMYHHFCDFINLYLTKHFNQTFSLDINILIWDTYPYRSNFGSVWNAFTRNKILDLQMFRSKMVCFKDVIFSFLPRMIFGLYYNMPLIPGCRSSGLFRAFNRHLLHYLNQSSSEQLISKNDSKIRIIFLKRETKHRRVLNQEELIERLEQKLKEVRQNDQVEIKSIDFNHRMSFMEQIKISSRTDILIGIHGAGLTHTLFQPDYGVLFELYNCEDESCYKDLARLRGTHYITWKDKTKFEAFVDDQNDLDKESLGKAHAKFVNYKFDPNEFVRLTLEAIEIVRQRRDDFKSTHFNHFNLDKPKNEIKLFGHNKVEL